MPKKSLSGLKQKKWTLHIFYIILHIQISLVWNFTQTDTFDFFDQIRPERYFPLKKGKVYITTESYIFELV